MKFRSVEMVVSRSASSGGGRPRYHYSPIDKEASEIRLMTLLPGTFGSKVCLTINSAVLSDISAPEYEALSYAWGSAKRSAKICVIGAGGERALAVTRNLAEALQYLRYEDRPRVLWIDAICVDQDNIPERGHQVVRMAEIYPQASRVVVWLGPERDDSALAFQVLNDLGSTVEVNWAAMQVRPLSGDLYDHWLKKPLPFVEDRKTSASIKRLLNRSYFKRLWIWQEIRLARTGAHMMCGEKKMLWDTFRNAMMCIQCKATTLPPNLNDGTQQVLDFSIYARSQSRLETLIYKTRYAECTDERDKIYAILNLAQGSVTLEPDYSRPTEEVFKSVVLGLATKLKDLTVLTHCEMRVNQASRVASWVPDWTIPSEGTMISNQAACLGTQAQAHCNDQNMLVVSGCLVDTLHVVEQMPPTTTFPTRIPQLGTIVRKFMRGHTEDEPYVAGGLVIDALCRTLCCNTFAGGFMPPVPDFPDLQESKEHVRNLMDPHKLVQMHRYFEGVNTMTLGRAFFRTRNGYIGLAPSSIKSGDQACVVLGCRSPLILRPTDDQRYMLVGECYVDGFMDGEALLGTLPSNWQYVRRYFPDLGQNYDVLMETTTGDIQVEDPRLGPLPVGWHIADHGKKHAYSRFSNEQMGVYGTVEDPRLSPEALKARGVKLQDICLV